MYWEPGVILPYQRVYNFVNGPRSIGKTYSLLKWLIRQGLKGKAFGYIVRTQLEKGEGVLSAALQKVLQNEYPDLDVAFSSEHGVCGGVTICQCFALTEAVKLKRRSFPHIHYLFFDEYTIEDGTARYINGFQEPELFMNLYHTIDREEGRVKCFFMGNNTSYYNPYHLYPAFGLPPTPDLVENGGIWTNKSTLFQRAVATEELEKKRKGNVFLESIAKTRYGEYAVQGSYRDDRYQPIQKLGQRDIYRCTVHTPEGVFGVYTNPSARTLIFAEGVDMKFPIRFSLVKEGYVDGYPYIKPQFEGHRSLFRYAAMENQLFYTSMGVKAKVEPYLIKLI